MPPLSAEQSPQLPEREPTPQARAVRAILFDAVGTLIYPDPPVADVYGQAGRQFGSARSPEEVERRFRAAFARFGQQKASVGEGAEAGATDAGHLRRPGTSGVIERARWRDLVSSVFDDVPDAGGPLFEHLWQHFAQPNHWRTFSDVEPTLEELAQRGRLVGIASNFDQRIFAIIEDHPVLRRWFDRRHLFVSAGIGFSKPDPRFFRFVERALGLASGQLLLVGDDPTNDVAGAHAAGWHAAHLARDGSVEQPCQFGEVERMAESVGTPGGTFCPPDPLVRLRRLGELLEVLGKRAPGRWPPGLADKSNFTERETES